MDPTDIVLSPGDPSLGVNNCIHNSAKNDVCLKCTKCVFCQNNINSSNYATFDADNATQIFCHETCLTCPSGLGECREYSSVIKDGMGNLIITPYCEHDTPWCLKCGNPSALRMGMDLVAIFAGKNRFYYHNNCQPVNECQVCQKNITLKTMMQTGNIYHHIEFACTPGQCVFCSKLVLDSPCMVKFPNLGGYTTLIVHATCMTSRKCHRCGTSKGEMFVDMNWNKYELVHQNKCYSDICPTCSVIIGIEPSVEVKNINVIDRYHLSCLKDFACYVCGASHHMNLIKDVVYIRHSVCDPTLCAACNVVIGVKPKRIIDGISYHGGPNPCGPKCNICSIVKYDDSHTLKKHGDGPYVHETCSGERCRVCTKHLGESSKWLQDQISGEQVKYHKQCSYICSKCEMRSFAVDRIPFDSEINVKNLPFLPHKRRLEASACRRALLRRGLQKDVRRIIVKLILNTPHDKTLLPYRDNGKIDLRNCCTPVRCKTDKCQKCLKTLNWTKNPLSNYCNSEMCFYIKTALHKIICLVFGGKTQQLDPLEFHFNWPDTEENGLKSVSSLMISRVATLTEKQISIYNALMTSIRQLLQVKKNEEEDSSSSE